MDTRWALMVLGWCAGWWLFWRLPLLQESLAGLGRSPADPTDPGALAAPVRPPFAVVVPARNEELSIGALLGSIGASGARPAEVVVVDDGSDDATAAIVESFPGVRLLRGRPLEPGWTGKCWACHQGAEATAAPILVFLDADVELGEGGLGAIVDAAVTRGGLLSVQPFHRVRRSYERLSALFNVVAVMGVGAAGLGRGGRSHGAFGPVLACRRADYEAVGGHVAIRGQVVDDLALAGRFTDEGRPVTVLGGGRLVRFRMYPGGVGQLIEGWSKNFATGAGAIPLRRSLLTALWVTALLVSVQCLVEPVVGRAVVPTAVAWAVAGAFALQLAWMLRQVGNFGVGTTLAYPVVLGVFVVVFARSLWLTAVRREVRWRGRSIALHGHEQR